MKQFFEEKYLLRLKDKNVLDLEHDDIFYHESFNLNFAHFSIYNKFTSYTYFQNHSRCVYCLEYVPVNEIKFVLLHVALRLRT